MTAAAPLTQPSLVRSLMRGCGPIKLPNWMTVWRVEQLTDAELMRIAESRREGAEERASKLLIWVRNEWGRCWHQRDYYRPYGTIDSMTTTNGESVIDRYRPSYGYYGPRWDHGWRRDQEDDYEQ
jgi:hypothetical protein